MKNKKLLLESKLLKNSRLTQNLGLKIAALLFAALLWLVVVNVDDPVDSVSFRNIPVSVSNEEVVTNKGKVYQIVDGTNTVNVTVYATRSVLSKLTADDIVATADLSQMEVNTFLVPIQVSVRGFEGKNITAEATPKNLQVEIEDVTKNSFPISISTSGVPRDGYVVGEVTANPERITVRGSESMIANINKVVAQVNVEGRSTDCELEAKLVYYDGNGNPMDASQLKSDIGDEGVTVKVQILPKKNVELHFNISGTPAAGYIYTDLSCEPQTIQICGTEDVLSEIDEIEIPEEVINIEGKDSKIEISVDITPYLPEGVRLVDESANNVIVTVGIEQEGSKTIELPVEAVRVDNLADKLKFAFDSVTEIQFQFAGIEEILEKLDIRNAAFIDLGKYTEAGTYEVSVNVEPIEGVSLLNKPVVKIILSEKKEENNGDKEE